MITEQEKHTAWAAIASSFNVVILAGLLAFYNYGGHFAHRMVVLAILWTIVVVLAIVNIVVLVIRYASRR